MSEGNTTFEARMDVSRCFADEAVAAERAFAIRAAYDGIPAAFLSVLAEDSLICGDGPELGRPVYETLPKDCPGRLQWEPRVVAASPDGTLAFTSGPYRLLDSGGHERNTGVYFSVWRRNADSGHLQLVIDFGSKGGAFPEIGVELMCLPVSEPVDGTGSMDRFLSECVQQGRCPSMDGALRLGDTFLGSTHGPSGCHRSQDGGLGVLWGVRTRSDGTKGGFVIVLGSGDPEPVPLACMNA